MATKKFLIEVEEGETLCDKCPFFKFECRTDILSNIDCNEVDFATMKIKELEENNESKSNRNR